MTPIDRIAHDAVLYNRMQWFVSLRWLAGSIIITWSLLDVLALGWHDRAATMVLVGAAILIYNHVLWWTLRRRRRGSTLLAMATAQIVLDLFCLTLLTAWTGQLFSPLLGFFVFHMIFASLMLMRWMAYATAAAAIAMLALSLQVTGDWPTARTGWLSLLAWAMVLVLTVYLVNGIARRLRRHRHRLLLQNRRITQMNKQLQAHQEAMIQHEKLVAMGQMAAGIAHEIANPLANIDSLLQLMQRNPQRMTESNMAKIAQQSARIRRTIQQMTEFAHPAPSQWRLMPLNDIAEMGVEMVRFDRRRKQIEVEQQFEAGDEHVRVQPQAMQQVLTNLLLNAIDAVADREDARIAVRTSVHGGAGRIDVIDNGPGIPAELRQRVFDPFYTTKPVGKGTGLGLAISYNLVQSVGGRISIEDTPGGGTTFRIELELAQPPAQSDSPSLIPKPGHSDAQDPLVT